MKRSEMLQLIAKSIQEKIGGHYSSFDEHAEAALEACEKAGMLPTHFYLSNAEGLITISDLQDFYEIDGNFEWELEDEKK